MDTLPIGKSSMRRIRLRWALRRFGFCRNAMRRPLDRAQSVIGVGMFLVFLVLGPIVAARAFHNVYDSGARAEQRQSATRHRVDATVVQRVTREAKISGQVLGGRDRVQWRGPDGSPRSGVVDTGARVGAHVTLWVDDSGRISGMPQTRTQTIGSAALAGGGGMAAVAAPLALGYALIRRRFHRHRLAAWDGEWELISPHWTGRG